MKKKDSEKDETQSISSLITELLDRYNFALSTFKVKTKLFALPIEELRNRREEVLDATMFCFLSSIRDCFSGIKGANESNNYLVMGMLVRVLIELTTDYFYILFNDKELERAIRYLKYENFRQLKTVFDAKKNNLTMEEIKKKLDTRKSKDGLEQRERMFREACGDEEGKKTTDWSGKSFQTKFWNVRKRFKGASRDVGFDILDILYDQFSSYIHYSGRHILMLNDKQDNFYKRGVKLGILQLLINADLIYIFPYLGLGTDEESMKIADSHNNRHKKFREKVEAVTDKIHIIDVLDNMYLGQ